MKRLKPCRFTLTVLVNNVGYGFEGLADGLSIEVVDKIVTANALAAVLITQAFLTDIVKSKGNILFISAGAATHPMPRLAHYSASKFFIHGLVRGLRVDLKGTGVHITEIQPGPVATSFGKHSQQSAASFSAHNPLKRVEITASQCARESIKALKKNKALHYPGWQFRLIIRLTKLLPNTVMEHVLQSFITRSNI
ncbi:SDR family NAD(P)-dependent oxidoreductase [Streptococcus dentiloxodontae]